MAIYKIEIQDDKGNVMYPRTSADVVKYNATQTLKDKIDELISKVK